MRKGIVKEKDSGGRYISYWMDGLKKRAFHIHKQTENPEIHIDIKQPIQVIATEGDLVIVFGHKKNAKNVIFEKVNL